MTRPPINEQALLSRLKQGDEKALGELYYWYAAELVVYAGARLFRLEDARDIVQDVFIKFWKERDGLDVSEGAGPYLYTMTRNKVIDHIRKNAVRERYGLLLQYLGPPETPDAMQQLEAKETAARIQAALDSLSPRVREVYLMSREQHLSIPEIAAQLDVAEQTVKNQLTTALNHLRKTLIVPAVFLVSASCWWLS